MEFLVLFALHKKNSHCDGSIVIFDGCWIKLILTQINRPCTSGFPSENLLNRARTHAPTAPRLTSNVSENIEDAQEAAPNLCQVTPPGCLPPRHTGFLTQRPLARRRVACPTSARRHLPHGPSAHQDRRPQIRCTSGGQERQNKFKLCTTNGQSNRVTQSARRPRQ